MHPTEDQLYSYYSQETSGPDRERLTAHLHTCPACQTTLHQIQTRSDRVASLITTLDPTPTASPLTPTQAYTRFQTKSQPQENTMIQKLFSRQMRPILATSLILTLLTLSLTIPSIRAAAVEFLGLFRVQQIEVVEFNPANLPANLGNSASGFEQLIANDLQLSETGDPVEVADAAEASQIAGFNVILPQGLDGKTQLTVQPDVTASFKVNLPLWQALLEELGRSDIIIPAELDGQTLTLYVDHSVTFTAGTCTLTPEEFEKTPYQQRDCTVFVQTPSPTLDAPPTLPINEIAQAGLQFLGMSTEDAALLSEKIDWATTLVVPVPTGSNYREITVQGVTGILYLDYNSTYGQPHTSLLWVKDGIVYSLSTTGTEADLLALANSLK